MKQYVCSVCSYTYDESKGIPEAGIAPGTRWEDLPDDWKCPWCGAGKKSFIEKKSSVEPSVPQTPEKPHVEKELSPMEMSIICSNLARGCEKQYFVQQSEAFRRLAEFFRGKAEPVKQPSMDKLLQVVNRDLSVGYPYGYSVSSADRGALRCQVWSEKVTRMIGISRKGKRCWRILVFMCVRYAVLCMLAIMLRIFVQSVRFQPGNLKK